MLTCIHTKCTKTCTVKHYSIFFPHGAGLMDVHHMDSELAVWARGYILKWGKELLSPEATEEKKIRSRRVTRNRGKTEESELHIVLK